MKMTFEERGRYALAMAIQIALEGDTPLDAPIREVWEEAKRELDAMARTCHCNWCDYCSQHYPAPAEKQGPRPVSLMDIMRGQA